MKPLRPAPLLQWPEIMAAKERVVQLRNERDLAFNRSIFAPFGKKRQRQEALKTAAKNLLIAEIEYEKLQNETNNI